MVTLLLLKLKALGAKVLSFVKARWKYVLALGLVLGAFCTGRGCAPKPATQEKTETKLVETHAEKSSGFTQEQVQQQVELALAQERSTHTHTVTRETKLPSGAVSIVTTSDRKTESKSSAKSEEKTQEVRIQYVERVVHDTVTETKVETKTVETRAGWHVAPLVGLDFASLVKGKAVPVFGAHVERRVAGPVWVGLWGEGSSLGGAGGVSVGLSF